MEEHIALFKLRILADKERSAPGADSKETMPTRNVEPQALHIVLNDFSLCDTCSEILLATLPIHSPSQ